MKLSLLILLLVPGLFLPVSGASPDGLTAYYKLDEGKGDIARDSSGNGLDARLVGTTWEKFGVRGQAVRFDPARKAHIRLPLDTRLKLDKAMTLSLYFKVDEFYKGLALFSLGNYYQGWTSYLYKSFIAFASHERGSRDKRSGGICRVKVGAGTGPLVPFHNVVFTMGPDPDNPSQNQVCIYLDGRLCSNKGISAFPLRAPIRTSDRIPITIGAFSAAECQWFSGIIDEIKIYSRVLSGSEIEADYRKTIAASGEDRAEAVKLKKVEFKPLKNRRVAVYVPLKISGNLSDRAAKSSEGKGSPRYIDGWPKPVQSADWFRKQAQKLGCAVTLIDDDGLTDKKLLNRKNFDTLIMPAAVMPFEAEDSVYGFLVSGGNLLIPSVLPGTYRKNADGTFGKFKGRSLLKNHSYGWYSPFLIRVVPGPEGRRRWTAPLGLNPGVTEITGDLLPAKISNPETSRRVIYHPVNKWEKTTGTDLAYGDGCNYGLAADLQTDLYREPGGIGCGFTVYRYYNNLIFGSTLAVLGTVGSRMIAGPDGDKYFKAVMYLLESRLPGEQSQEYYRTAVNLHREWSELGFIFTEALAALRDAAFHSYLCGGNWKAYAEKQNGMEREFALLSAERKTQKNLLISGKTDEARRAAAVLLGKVRRTAGKFGRYAAEGKAAVKEVKIPAKPAVKHKYGTVPSIATITLPVNLALMRGRLFDSVRRIGSNVFGGLFDIWYAEDPLVREKMKGISRDHKFIYSAGPRTLVRGGRFNPASGNVKDEKAVVYPEKALSAQLEDLFRVWKWKGAAQFRISTADETGLGLNYWGTQAKNDLQEHLKQYYYGDIKAMNAHCGTSFRSFEEVTVPVRKPETPAEHAIWEHFNRCREAYLELIYANFRRLVKQHNPAIDVSAVPSTGGSLLPLYGQNLYKLTRYQDVSGIDGTCCGIEREWLFLDLADKRYLTGEWGALYQESPIQTVHAQIWQELSGGSLGLEQHVWSYGDDSVNYIDSVNCATIYGALLHMALKDVRKLDHLVLDGKRADPETGILYSQTSRIHDQGWGWAGGSTLSPHMAAVNSYYKHFLSWGRSARVFPEEALLEGKVPPVKVLIVPQAEFLSGTVQKALLEYVKNGGYLVLEGRAGRFDEFGRKSDLIFREADVVPAFTDGEKIRLEGRSFPVGKTNSIYSPSGKGRVLASFDGENAAILTKNFGKGSITFTGFGLSSGSGFAPVLERILRSLKLNARFKVSDDSLVLREWIYNNENWLFFSSRSGRPGKDWGLKEVKIRIRGRVEVEDYLFGKNVKTRFRDGYTEFTALFANGGRVFRLRNRPEPAGILTDKADFELGGKSGPIDAAKIFNLPFRGKLYADTPLKNGDHTFAAVILGSGADARAGNAFLNVSSSAGESRRIRLEEGRTFYVRMRKRIFRVKCLQNFFMYPFYTVLEIEEVKTFPFSSGAKAVSRGGKTILSNDLISLTFSRRGAEMISFLPLAEKEDIVRNRKAGVISGSAPGPFHNVDFLVKTGKTGDGVTAEFKLKAPVANRAVTQKATLLSDAAACRMDIACTSKARGTASFDLRYRAGLQLGGADNAVVFFIRQNDGSVRRIVYQGQDTGKKFPDSGNWAAVVNTRTKTAWIELITKKSGGEYFYIWEGPDFYNLELFCPVRKIPPEQLQTLALQILYMHGLTGVSDVGGLNAFHLVLPDIADQKKEFLPRLEAATASNRLVPMTVSAELYRNGKKVMDFRKVSGTAAFDLPMVFNLKPVGNVNGFADGAYTLKVDLVSEKGNLSCRKKIVFSGRKLEQISADCEALKKQFCSQEKKLSRDRKFAIRVKLAELKSAIAGSRLENAEKIISELKTEMK